MFEKLPVIRSAKWLAVGRLDFNTGGLLIFTTSGELANRLMHPRFEVEREYAVRLFGSADAAQVQEFKKGVRLSDGDARFDVLEEQGGEGRNRWYRVVLNEGRNRVVRRMFEALGLQVSRLMRVRFGIVCLPPRLKRGNWIELKEAEISQLLEWAGSAPAAPHEDVSAQLAPPVSRNTKPSPPEVSSQVNGSRGERPLQGLAVVSDLYDQQPVPFRCAPAPDKNPAHDLEAILPARERHLRLRHDTPVAGLPSTSAVT